MITQQDSPRAREEVQAAEIEENEQQQQEAASTCPVEPAFRPLTRIERRNLWMKAYGEQDVGLHMWTRLVEHQDLEIEMLLQMRGLLVFGVMVSTRRYVQYYIDLNEDLHREREPETAEALRSYYLALVPPEDQPAIGPEGLPIISHSIHMRDVTIMNAGQKIQVPYWRGKLSEVDAFVMGATVPE